LEILTPFSKLVPGPNFREPLMGIDLERPKPRLKTLTWVL
jgi:hypothetical protein